MPLRQARLRGMAKHRRHSPRRTWLQPLRHLRLLEQPQRPPHPRPALWRRGARSMQVRVPRGACSGKLRLTVVAPGLGELRSASPLPAASAPVLQNMQPGSSPPSATLDDSAAQASYMRMLADWNAQQDALAATVRFQCVWRANTAATDPHNCRPRTRAGCQDDRKHAASPEGPDHADCTAARG